MGAARLSPFSRIMQHLGYPAYFMTIIGFWYVLGGVAILAPRLPRLKEWAYAGLIFVYSGAVASRLAVGDPPVTLVGPIIFTALVAASSALRPSARRVLVSRSVFSLKTQSIPNVTERTRRDWEEHIF
jgi:hypothetical protein